MSTDLAERYGHRVHLYCDDQGEAIPLAPPAVGNQPLGTHLYVCGPAGMIELGARHRAIGRLAGAERCISERSSRRPPARPTRSRSRRPARRFRWGRIRACWKLSRRPASTRPICAAAAPAANARCQVLALDGTLLHNDHFLTAAEKASGTKVMPCVSRFEGRSLVLGL